MLQTMVSRSAFYPTYISVVNLLQSLHFGGVLNHKKRCVCRLQPLGSARVLNPPVHSRYFWIIFAAIFFWEWCVSYLWDSRLRSRTTGAYRIPQYPFPLLTAISIVCLVDNGRHTFVRNLFGAGSSNEGIGLFSFGTSWTLITQGNPLVWPLRTRM